MRNEAYNMDCIEYMRGLPDNVFDIAVCDPPYGKGNDDNLVNGGDGSDRDSKSISELRGGKIKTCPHRDASGGWFRRYDKPMEQTAGRTQGKILQASGHIGSAEGRGQRGTKSGGAKQKLHNGTSLLHRSSSMSFSASAAIR